MEIRHAIGFYGFPLCASALSPLIMTITNPPNNLTERHRMVCALDLVMKAFITRDYEKKEKLWR